MSTNTEKNGFAARGPKMRAISRKQILRSSAQDRVEANAQSRKRRSFQDQPTRYRNSGVRSATRLYSSSRAPYSVPMARESSFDVLGRLFGKIFGVFSKPASVDYYDQYDPMRRILSNQKSWRSDNDDYRPSGYMNGHF